MFVFDPPPTTADVLDWRVWVQFLPGVEAQILAGIQWACRWLHGDWSADDLGSALAQLTTDETYTAELVGLCNAIAESAGVPQASLDGMSALLDKQNGVPPDWKPEPVCKCRQCRRGLENPRGQMCMYDDLDPRSIGALRQVGEAAGAERYYVTQVRAVIVTAENRRLAFERETREAEAKSAEMLDEWRGRH